MNNFAAAGLGCLAALAIWKGTKERWFPALIGVLIVVVTVKFAIKSDDGGDGLGWLIWLVGYGIFIAGYYGLKRWDKRIAKLSPSPALAPKSSVATQQPSVDSVEEPTFELGATTAYIAAQSGWDGWEVFPNPHSKPFGGGRLVHNHCAGGPPDHTEVYEYEVRHTSVFVRLLEKSSEGFEGNEYEVFGGSVNVPHLEEVFAKRTKTETDPFWLDWYKPETVAAKLQKEIAWHEIYGAIRYFILSKHPRDWNNNHFFKDELDRFTKLCADFEKKVKELGVVYNSRWNRYDAPEGSTPEVKKDVAEKLLAYNCGFRNGYERDQREIIVAVLTDLVQPQPSTAKTGTHALVGS